MKTICHLTSVHKAIDTRIFHKECTSLSKKYIVNLIGIHNKMEMRNNVNIIPFPKFNSRMLRILISPFVMFNYAIKIKSELYHCHDPELFFTMLLLKIFTKSKLVYDMHEDYLSAIVQKPYLPKPLKTFIASIIRKIELIFCNHIFDSVILAEKYYNDIYKKGVTILNYPILSFKQYREFNKNKEILLLYTGTVSVDRGAFIQSKIVDFVENCKIEFMGFCNTKLSLKIISKIKKKNNFNITGINKYISREIIDNNYTKKKWLAALAIFPKTNHYYQKELTKFFEYMSAGLPIIASNFPVWKSIIEKNKCGICVDPNDKKAIKNAILKLYNNNDLRNQYSQNGLELVQKKYNWITQEKILLDLYREIL